MKKLVIVESPTKAKTISKFLNKNFEVESSFGHIRDLPKSTMGIDIEHNFDPKYIIPKDKSKRVTALKKKAAKAREIYFATDEDREGEAISWHLAEVFGLDPSKTKRITFHEVTKDAIVKALENPRAIDLNLVNAQQARRVLDRLVGYELSPFLWKKVFKGLSAGRVQSVAVRLIVEREREIQSFKPTEYWSIDAWFLKQTSSTPAFESKLYKIGENVVEKFDIQHQEQAEKIVKEIETSKNFSIETIEKKATKKTPPPPFTTSTLQQSGNNRFGFSAKQTMMLAQQLYEGIDLGEEGSTGLITYMRTDSVTLSAEFLQEARQFIQKQFGENYALPSPRFYKTKSKSSQEAHEAIRPSSIFRTPDSMKPHLDERQYKLYKLIWERACACQMKEALLDTTIVSIVTNWKTYTLRSVGSTIQFDGWLKVTHHQLKENMIPVLSVNEELTLEKLAPNQHSTEPPPRYTEASLVKTLEEYGIGRPSTYAPTIATIQERNYIKKEDKQLQPTEIAFLVSDLLVQHFPEIVDYQFTAQMEDSLDQIADGEKEWRPMIAEFYQNFKTNLEKKYEEVAKTELAHESTFEICEKCGAPMTVKMSRFGKFLACTKFPECRSTKQLPGAVSGMSVEEEKKLLAEKCQECGNALQMKRSRYGSFVGCSNYPNCKYIKPIQQETGVACPQCGEGQMVSKKSKRGKIFFSCNRYPKCEFALWNKPTGEKCSSCASLLVEKKDGVVCSKSECKDSKIPLKNVKS